MKLSPTIHCALCLVLTTCRAGPISDEGAAEAEADPMNDGVLGDPWHCGELGLVCVGPLGIGECIDDQCQPKLGPQCWGAEFAPTCDHYCDAFELSCAYRGCEDATVWGWTGDQAWADGMCGDGKKTFATPLAVTCDKPLDGLLTSFRCCCE